MLSILFLYGSCDPHPYLLNVILVRGLTNGIPYEAQFRETQGGWVRWDFATKVINLGVQRISMLGQITQWEDNMQ
jgi:hypothetical protein